MEEVRVRYNNDKNKEYQLVVSNNEDVAAPSFISLHDNNIEDYEKQDIVSNT